MWEWRDHALWRTLPDGRRALSYGGDFGEEVHDGSFVCDGLIDALVTPLRRHLVVGGRRWPRTLPRSLARLRLSSPRADMAQMRSDCTLSSARPSRSCRSDDDVADSPYALDARGRLTRIGDHARERGPQRL